MTSDAAPEVGRIGAPWAWALLVALVVMVASVMGILQRAPVQPMAGVGLIERGLRCSDSAPQPRPSVTRQTCQPVALPDRSTVPPGASGATLRYRFGVPRTTFASAAPAILIERARDAIEVRVNGQLVSHRLDPQAHRWNRPQYLLVPTAILHDGINTLDVTIHSFATGPLQLEPFYVGSADALYRRASQLTVVRVGFSRIGLGLAMAGAGLFLGLALFNNRVAGNGWLLLANLAACVFLAQAVFLRDPFDHQLWTVVWTAAIFVYAYAMIRAFGIWAAARHPALDRLFAATIGLGTLAQLLVPPQVWPVIQTGIAATGLLAGLGAGVALLRNWPSPRRLRDLILLALITAALAICALSVADLTALLGPGFRGIPQLVPVLGFVALTVALLSQLIQSSSHAAALNRTLNAQVRERTERLAQTHARIEDLTAERARHTERQRILLDLHDGIGGQLVSMLAYLDNQPGSDPVLHGGLETALSDLGLMMDSLENTESVTTLLGSLRDRIEPMLGRHGLRFDWQILDDPVRAAGGPTMNLMLLRIVQEAITNVVKHAGASVIRLECDAHHIAVIDNGRGFGHGTADSRGTGHGHGQGEVAETGRGLKNMRRRAAEIGAAFSISRIDNRTVVRLTWPDPTGDGAPGG